MLLSARSKEIEKARADARLAAEKSAEAKARLAGIKVASSASVSIGAAKGHTTTTTTAPKSALTPVVAKTASKSPGVSAVASAVATTASKKPAAKKVTGRKKKPVKKKSKYVDDGAVEDDDASEDLGSEPEIEGDGDASDDEEYDDGRHGDASSESDGEDSEPDTAHPEDEDEKRFHKKLAKSATVKSGVSAKPAAGDGPVRRATFQEYQKLSTASISNLSETSGDPRSVAAGAAVAKAIDDPTSELRSKIHYMACTDEKLWQGYTKPLTAKKPARYLTELKALFAQGRLQEACVYLTSESPLMERMTGDSALLPGNAAALKHIVGIEGRGDPLATALEIINTEIMPALIKSLMPAPVQVTVAKPVEATTTVSDDNGIVCEEVSDETPATASAAAEATTNAVSGNAATASAAADSAVTDEAPGQAVASAEDTSDYTMKDDGALPMDSI